MLGGEAIVASFFVIHGYHQTSFRHFMGMWQIIWCAVIFSIWIARNNYIFKGSAVDTTKLMEDIKLYSWSWMHNKMEAMVGDWYFTIISVKA
ncbi:hypothetical protein GmHk_10G029700 [Glycine max]|nr:hypothetical protein GmHk_10G029700 [Glycine max]